LNAQPDAEIIQAIAIELAVDPSFVEKDWHAMRVVGAIVDQTHEGMRLVFSGGTSLSKGYGLIQRFSEDLDFKVILPEPEPTRPKRRQYRKKLVERIRTAGPWNIEDDDITSGGGFFKCRIGYSPNFSVPSALRTQIQLEVSFRPPALRVEERSLQSFVAHARQLDPEVQTISCVAPSETAADKIAALTWRIPSRRRDDDDDDPTVVRHLHDLVALEQLATENPVFPKLLAKLVRTDAKRDRDGDDGRPPEQRIANTLKILASDPEYPKEYEQFVLSMSYAAEGEAPDFTAALETLRRLTVNV
jgi:predicted nucleotidyltransferase component of viral defense system